MLRRNTGFWLSSIIVAVVSILVFGWLFNPDTRAFDLGLVDEDVTEASGVLVAAFESVDNVEVVVGERDAEFSALEEGDRSAMVVIPAGFERDLASGGASLRAYYDNSDVIRVGYVTTTVNAIIGAYNKEIVGVGSAVTIEEEAISTEQVRYIDFLIPGMVGMAIMYINLGVGFLSYTPETGGTNRIAGGVVRVRIDDAGGDYPRTRLLRVRCVRERELRVASGHGSARHRYDACDWVCDRKLLAYADCGQRRD
jgi:ABC-2 type transport system permease protein